MMVDEAIPDKTRLDIARMILARVYQKEQQIEDGDNTICFVLDSELKKFAK